MSPASQYMRTTQHMIEWPRGCHRGHRTGDSRGPKPDEVASQGHKIQDTDKEVGQTSRLIHKFHNTRTWRTRSRKRVAPGRKETQRNEASCIYISKTNAPGVTRGYHAQPQRSDVFVASNLHTLIMSGIYFARHEAGAWSLEF